MRSFAIVVGTVALAPFAQASRSIAIQGGRGEAELSSNPIRKVVTLLQRMQKKVMAEGEKEKALYDKFMCYCKKGDADLATTISTADSKVPELQSSIEAAKQQKEQLVQELKDHEVGRKEAKVAMDKATAIREKEAAAYAKESSDLKTNIAALKSGIEAITKGMAGGFLQTTTAKLVRQMAISGPSMTDHARQTLLAFFSVDGGLGYMPKSGEITGILGQLKDDMDKSLEEATSAEKEAIATYQDLMSAKTKEVETLTAAIESKSQRVADLGVKIATEEHDLADTQQGLAADQAFLAELSKNCDTKTKEWEVRIQTRSEELATLAETIKVLSEDDALELFKKTLPGTGFLQLRVNTQAITAKALQDIAKARAAASAPALAAAPRVDLLALALRGKKVGLEKVMKMIDDLVATLKKEQADDDAKKEYCGQQLDSSDDKKKSFERVIAGHEHGIVEAEDGLATLAEEIKALEASIKAMDKSVAEATQQRQQEHAEFTELLANNQAAKKILLWAKNRLAKFYTPKLHKPEPKRDLGEEQGAVFAQVSAHSHRREAPPPPPETFGAYAKKTEDHAGVVAMMDLLVKDLDKEITEAETEEKDAQAEYVETMSNAQTKRATDSKSLTEKEGAKAHVETALASHREGKAGATKELAAVLKFIASLHSECDWLLQYHNVRKEARADEVDSLQRAKAVLSGADFSLLQQHVDPRSRTSLRRAL